MFSGRVVHLVHRGRQRMHRMPPGGWEGATCSPCPPISDVFVIVSLISDFFEKCNPAKTFYPRLWLSNEDVLEDEPVSPRSANSEVPEPVDSET